MHKDIQRNVIQPIIALDIDKELRNEEIEKKISEAISESGIMGQYATKEVCYSIANIVTHVENAKFSFFGSHEFWIESVPFI